MFSQLIRFELQYQFRQRAFLLFSFLFMILGITIGKQGYSRGTTIYNSSQSISEITAIMTLGSVFIIMFFAISGVLRDKQYNSDQIIFSTSMKKHHFFLSRFIGVFFTSVIAFSFFLVGFAFTSLQPGLDPEFVNPFKLTPYFWSLLIIVMPNIFISSAVIFSVSIMTKNNVATYVSAILIYVLYFISSIFLNSPVMAQSVPSSPETMALAALFDPFGIAAMFEQTQFWTGFQKNSQHLGFTGNFMLNRLLWMALGFVLLMVSYFSFSFRKANQKIKSTKIRNEKPLKKQAYKPAQIRINFASWTRAFVSLLQIELKAVFRSLPFIGIMILWITIVVIEIYSRIHEGGQYNDSLYPVTNLLIELYSRPLFVLGNILIVFYSGEIVWRERSLYFNNIVDATPTANSAFFMSKFITLILLPCFLIIAGIIVAIGFQIAKGYTSFEFSHYASLFYTPGLTFLFYSLMAVFVQSLVRNKYLGMGITGLVIIFMGTTLSSITSLEHPLLLIGKLPLVGYTNMNGYSDITKEYNLLALYWLAFGTILGLISFKLWQRGNTHSMRFRAKQIVSNWSIRFSILAVLLCVVYVSSGAIVFYNTNIVSDYMNNEDNLDYREAYELKFKKHQNIKGLFPVAMTTKVDLFPTDQRYEIEASYVMENKSENPQNQVFITETEVLSSISIENAELVEHDAEYGTYLFQFENPVLPGQKVGMDFKLVKQLEGFEVNQALVSNGSYIMHREFEPALSYRKSMEISNELEREKRNLPVRVDEKVSDDHILNFDSYLGRVNYETIISTDKNQIALGSGELIKQWSEGNRNFYHYKSESLIMPTMAYFSAEYEQRKDTLEDIVIEQYYHKNHDFNVERIAESTKQTLAYCNDNFGAYPFKHIRIAEIPGHWGFGGFAHAGTISMTEDRMYFIDLRDSTGFDLVAKRTIHEVAHQWFGHILAPKFVDGASMFIEGFAKYSEAVVMEKMYGKSAIWELSRNANNRYFTWRAFDNEQEPPLYNVNGQAYLSYGKNYTVMLALKELIGEEKVNQVIKTMITKHRDQVDLNLTSIEFIEELYKVTPMEYHVLIDDWFKRVITYDLVLDDASYKKLGNGKFEVTLKLQAKRYKQKESGEDIEISIDEPIQIGAFTAHPSKVKPDDILYLKPHQINKTTAEVVLVLDELPTHIGIDPFGTRSDENFHDNLFELE